MEVSLQLVGVAGVPLKATVLVPWVAPKPTPKMFTLEPIPPDVGDTLEMPGPAVTLNRIPLLATPPTVTTTLPLVAVLGTRATIEVELQLSIDAVAPLNFTVLTLWLVPKLVPVIVTGVNCVPEVGDRLAIVGGEPTVNTTPLLEVPLTVTNTLPVVADAGTGATIEVSLQLVGVAVVPLNVSALVP